VGEGEATAGIAKEGDMVVMVVVIKVAATATAVTVAVAIINLLRYSIPAV
jgi:hypothetical protein